MKEYCLLVESPTDTQKKIRQWMSAGYDIEFIYQFIINNLVYTSLYRTLKENK